jgi:hypothetical protein
VQFLLGTTVNLFVKIPADHPGANPPEYFGGVVASVSWAILHGGLWLTLHAALGLVLLLAALGMLVRQSDCAVADGSRSRPSAWSACSVPASMAVAS